MSESSSPFRPLYASLPSVYYHHDQLWAGTPEHFLAHLYDDFDYRDDDVWLSSYPRSGTAWSYEVLYAVLYEGDIAALQHAQSAGKVLKFLPIEIGSAASVPERLATWKALPSPRVIPTHLPYRLYPKTVLEHRNKRVYVVRNPKDVAVSYYHLHRSHKLAGYYKGTWAEFFECFLTGQVLYGSWFDHTLGWWPNLQASTDTVLQYRYEDMQQDLSAQIRRLGAFFGKRLSPHAVAAIADYASFASMSVNPFTNREGHPMMDFSIARFLRKGVIGDWVTHFTAEQNERFNTVGEQKMRGTTWHQYFAV
jgi:Sulfotransferase domain